MSLNIQAINSKDAPAPIGPYNQSIRAGDFLFCSGQIALDAATGQIQGSTVEEQAHKVMKNLGAVLKEAGLNFDRVVKTTIFLKSMADFPKVNEIYGSYLGKVPPARATVEVSRLPKDVLVEVDCIAAF